MLSQEDIEKLLRDYTQAEPLTDEQIEYILANAPQGQASEAFRERALERMAEAQRLRVNHES